MLLHLRLAPPSRAHRLHRAVVAHAFQVRTSRIGAWRVDGCFRLRRAGGFHVAGWDEGGGVRFVGGAAIWESRRPDRKHSRVARFV